MAVFEQLTGIGVASGFKLQAKAPLDVRAVVESANDRDALITENGAYEGMVVYVKADKTLYQLKGTTAKDWSALGGVYTHPNIETKITTSEETLEFGGTFDVVDAVSANEQGHVTGINTKTVTMPDAPAAPGIDEIEGLRAELDSKLEDAGDVGVDGGEF